MASDQVHRGPDAWGIAVSQFDVWQIALSHRRLSVIDLSESGNQPMYWPEASLTITYNGEIYNFRAIRKRLEGLGHTFRTDTDTEVVLHAYAQWGEACVSELEGMFAFALWDERNGTLFLARDRFGIKPLYYYHTPDRFAYASEVGAFIASGAAPCAVEPAAIRSFLNYGSVHGPHTILRDVFLLPPGHVGIWRDAGLHIRPYWNPIDHAYRGGAGASVDELSDLLHDAIASQLVSDVPLGVFLSGGIDSSAIVAAVAADAGIDLRTVSLTFAEEKYNEAPYARMVAERFGTHHTEVRLTADDVLKELPRFFQSMDQPSVDGVNTYMVSRAAREAGLTVALSGLGGDEVFGGYWSFALARKWSRMRPLMRSLPGPLRAAGARWGRAASRGRYRTLWRSLAELPDTAGLLLINRELIDQQTRARLLDDCSAALSQPWEREVGQAVADLDPVTATSILELTIYMHDTLLRDSDVMGMAHSLEIRVPLLNHHLAERVLSVAPERKLQPGRPKPLLLDALRQKLPDAIVYRHKQGFTFPFDVWMRGALRDEMENLLFSERTRQRGLLRTEHIRSMWTRYVEGQAAPGAYYPLWALAVLEHWFRETMDRSRCERQPAAV